MKETRYFYAPDALESNELPDEEAMHALRVLRLKSGDEMMLTDGKGNYYRAEVTLAATRKCQYKILETLPQKPMWKGRIQLVVAPTKMMDKMEWLVEKATEIGVNDIYFIICQNSERRVARTGRIEKIMVAAMKQSHKPLKPIVHETQTFKSYMARHVDGLKYIAHCYEEIDRKNLFDELRRELPQAADDESITIMVGPEGDFTIEEVKEAMKAGFIPISLGESRLRTETAGLVSVMMAHLANE